MIKIVLQASTLRLMIRNTTKMTSVRIEQIQKILKWSSPSNAIFGVTEGPSKAVADGFYVITEPLEKGNHTVSYKSTLSLPFAQDVTYTIIAK